MRKVLGICFLIALISLGGASAQNCKDNNPFFKNLPLEVQLSASQVSSQKSACHPIWGSGTCCDETRLATLARDRNMYIDRNLSMLIESLNQIEKTMDEKGNDKDYKKVMEDKAIDNFIDLKKKKNKNDFIVRALTCWAYMKKVRGAALCNTCASDGKKYFDHQKARITKATCDQMLEQCHPYFGEVLKVVRCLVKLHDRLVEIKEDAKKMKIKIDVDPIIKPLKKISEETKKHPILLHYGSYKTSLSTNPLAVNQTAAKELCSSLYVINNPTFVENFQPFMTLVKDQTATILKQYKDYLESLPRPRKLYLWKSMRRSFQNPRSNFRKLCGSSDSEFKFQFSLIGDTTLFGEGNNINNVHRDRCAMNLTLAFP